MPLSMELLRDLRASTRLLFLFEVTTTRHTRLRTIADRLGMTVQGASEYAHGLQADGLLALVSGEYRATKKGVELLHDQFVGLRGFVDRAGRALAFVETTAALAGGTVHRGDRVGLFMEGGSLVAHPARTSPSTGIAVHDASAGELVRLRDLEGIVALRPGRIVIARIRSSSSGKRGVQAATSRRLSRSGKDRVVAALDIAGLVAARDFGLKPRIEFAVLPATVEAAERGVDVLLLVPEERAAEAVQAIEAANAKLEDKIPYESVTFP
jgi:putative transcriptional regulator